MGLPGPFVYGGGASSQSVATPFGEEEKQPVALGIEDIFSYKWVSGLKLEMPHPFYNDKVVKVHYEGETLQGKP